MNHGWTWYIGIGILFACGEPRVEKSVADSASTAPNDSLVLRNNAGVEVWFTLARTATAAAGRTCIERGLEIRHRDKRIQVPLLYTGTPPVLLNDSTMRAMLWTHCEPGDAYLVDLRSGHPVRERRANRS